MAHLIARLRDTLRHDFFKLIGGSAYVFLFRIIGAASVYFTQVVIARWLGPADLGVYVYAFSWLVMLAIITGIGFPAACYRFIGHALAHEKPNLIAGYIRRSSQWVLYGSSLTALLAAVVVYYVPGAIEEAYRVPLTIAILTSPIMAMITLRNSIAQAFSWIDLSVIPHDAARPFVFLLILLLLWWLVPSADITTVMVIQFFVMLATVIVIGRILKRRISETIGSPPPEYETRKWLRGASPLLIIVLVGGYFSEVNMIVAGSFLSAEELAVFNAAFRTAFMIGFGIAAVDAITLPKAARMFAAGDMGELQRLLTHAAALKFMGALLAVGLFVLWGDLALALFGEGFDSGYLPMIILGIAMLIVAGTGAVAELLSISGDQDHCLYVFTVAFFVVTGLHAVFIPQYGLLGASISVLLTVLMYTTWLHIIVIRKMHVHPSLLGYFHKIKTRHERGRDMPEVG